MEFTTKINCQPVTVLVTSYVPAIPLSFDEPFEPAEIEYELYDEDGEELNWSLTDEQRNDLMDEYCERCLERGYE